MNADSNQWRTTATTAEHKHVSGLGQPVGARLQEPYTDTLVLQAGSNDQVPPAGFEPATHGLGICSGTVRRNPPKYITAGQRLCERSRGVVEIRPCALRTGTRRARRSWLADRARVRARRLGDLRRSHRRRRPCARRPRRRPGETVNHRQRRRPSPAWWGARSAGISTP
jgi:hypothetical protein